MTAAPTDVLIGHATDHEVLTGCTVVLFDRPTTCAVDVRGGAPGSRDIEMLQPGRALRRADAIVLTGGSAFGLGVVDGVMAELQERGRGFQIRAIRVPIVPAAVIFDLANGQPVWPTPEMGRRAVQSAVPIDRASWGAIGAGRGATTDKITGTALPGGIGMGSAAVAGGSIIAIAVPNPVGVIRFDDDHRAIQHRLLGIEPAGTPGENTTLAVVLVDAPLRPDDLHRIAVSAHDGMARAIVPCHTPLDGDIVFAAALREDHTAEPVGPLHCLATEVAVENAIRHAVTTARSDRN